MYKKKRTLLALPLLLLQLALPIATSAQNTDYLRNNKYSALQQINQTNVNNLTLAWEIHTGEPLPSGKSMELFSFQDQPSLIDGNLVVCTTSRRLLALDPKTGEQRWEFDPEDRTTPIKKCRGISHWVDTAAEAGSLCQSRILLGTADYRLIALDGPSGKPCPGFGDNGQVVMPPSKEILFPGEVSALSRPAIVNDVVVVGSAVADNQRLHAPSGRVLAFDVRTGKGLWEFDPVPRSANDPAYQTWPKGTEGFGQGNVWASMAVDNDLDLVYLPTSSPSSDFYGGGRPGDNLYTSGVVALKGSTGEVAWHYQFVHHNIWDYDTPSEALLVDYPFEGKIVPALVQNTKMGLVFIFDRATGKPLVPIEERPVPQAGAAPGEVLAATQPFPVDMPTLAPQSFSPEDAWGFTFIDKWLCKRKIKQFDYGPIYTPPSTKGTISAPASGGGPNWGGGAYDPDSHVMVVPSNRVPVVVTLLPADEAQMEKTDTVETVGDMTFAVKDNTYYFKIGPLLSPLGAPCSAPPWAALTALDIVNKKIVWEVPLGDISKLAPIPIHWEVGTPGAGGALVTAGGLVFIGYTLDDSLRAFDLTSGELLWRADLPAAGTAVPVTYQVDGEQYLVIAAGGHSMYGSTLGDSVVAFNLNGNN